jgi:hypothetical protein
VVGVRLSQKFGDHSANPKFSLTPQRVVSKMVM